MNAKDARMESLSVDPEFDGLCRALTPEELSLLEASIEADGCREPIVVWANHDDIIIDGHNRYRICTSLGIPFKTRAISLPDRGAVVEWMIANQLGRRNLAEEEKSYLRGRRYKAEKKKPHRPEKSDKGETVSPLKTADKLASEYGVTSRTIHNDAAFAEAVDAIGEVAPQAKAEILSGKSDLTRKQIQEVAETPIEERADALEAAKNPPSPVYVERHHCDTYRVIADLDEVAGEKFGCIYADPPWRYSNKATRANVDGIYDGTMTVDEVCALPVRDLVADDAHCHLWTTNAFLPDAFRVLEAWGFEYRSVFVWVKPQMGIGNYWRVSHEFLLLGIRGNAKRFNDRGLKSWFECDRGEHSAKPDQVRAMIEKASHGPYLELFGRKPVGGWCVFGNQVEARLFA